MKKPQTGLEEQSRELKLRAQSAGLGMTRPAKPVSKCACRPLGGVLLGVAWHFEGAIQADVSIPRQGHEPSSTSHASHGQGSSASGMTNGRARCMLPRCFKDALVSVPVGPNYADAWAPRYMG